MANALWNVKQVQDHEMAMIKKHGISKIDQLYAADGRGFSTQKPELYVGKANTKLDLLMAFDKSGSIETVTSPLIGADTPKTVSQMNALSF